ncbi:MAG: redoxin family protein [Gammaproteobacteria bacterium]
MKQYNPWGLAFCAALVLSLPLLRPVYGDILENPYRAPAFTHTGEREWLNSEPLTWDDLKGRVVLLDFWTFDCWNCYRSFPWLRSLETRLEPRGLQVIGVHTPEFEHEKVRENVAAKIEEFRLYHPVMMDNDFSYWNAMNNRFWPAFYIIDKQGRVRAVFYGETHKGDRRAKQIETIIRELLQES